MSVLLLRSRSKLINSGGVISLVKKLASSPSTGASRLPFMSAAVYCDKVMNEVTIDVPISRRLSSLRSASLILNLTTVLLSAVTRVPPVNRRRSSRLVPLLRCKVIAVRLKLVIFTVSSKTRVTEPSFMFK